MRTPVNIAEAKAHFSELVARAEAGEEVIIARGGKAVARLAPLAPLAPRQPGIARHWLRDPGWERLSRAILEPMSEQELDAAEGSLSDEWGISLSHRKRENSR